MSDTKAYLGIPGSLEEIALPKGTVDSTRIRARDVFQLANGGARVSSLTGGARRHTINYARLTYDTFKVLEAYEQGHRGSGPFVFLSPGQRNILTVNQSSTTSERNDTTGFTMPGTGSNLTSSSSSYRRGPRSLAWTFSATGASASAIYLDSPASEWYSYPVHVGRAMVLSCYAKCVGGDGAASIALSMRWLTVAGVAISTDTGSTLACTSSFQQATATGTPPATAAYCLPIITAVSGASAGNVIYIDELMLHEGSTPDSTWDPGGHILPVAPISLIDAFPFQAGPYRERPTFILQEVGGGAG